MKKIPFEIFNSAYDYASYRQLIDSKLEQRLTTDNDSTEAMLHYTFMNVTRMRRLDKTTRLNPETIEQVQAIDTPQKWLVITEGWCGDAAQIIPVLVKMATLNKLIDIRFILREEQPDIMDAFLTNEARSIPKVLILNEDLDVLNTWGPRPAEVQAEVMRNKAALENITDETERMLSNEASKKMVQKWYAKDKTQSIQAEFLTKTQLVTSNPV